MDDVERAAYDKEIVQATNLMRDNGDDDPLDLDQDEMTGSTDPSTAFWTYAKANGISKPNASLFLERTEGDFDAALKLMNEANNV